MIKKIKSHNQGFTLIEILIVIGLIAILAVVALLAINPAQAQKRTRDIQRMKDLSTIEGVLSQWIADGNGPTTGKCLDPIVGGTCNSSASTGTSESCSSNFLQEDLCKYANSIPVDPLNGNTVAFVNGAGSTTSTVAQYIVGLSGVDYEVNARLESPQNDDRVASDGGNDLTTLEQGTSLTIL
ncbi:MAG: type II secretion system protein [Candidatus Paceibacterota bacterium]